MFLLVASTEAVAFIAAGAALLGGVLGALTGGVVDWALERRRERAKAKAGARLIRSKLHTVAVQIGISESDGHWRSAWEMSLEEWESYRDVLAPALSVSQWAAVDNGVRLIRLLDYGIKVVETEEDGPKARTFLAPSAIEGLPELREVARLAYNALGPIAEGETADVEGDFGRMPEDAP
jgi:hypothetical protein